MDSTSWQAFYQSDLQQVWALLPVPTLWLCALLATGSSRDDSFPQARFVRLYAVVFCVETLLDPIATGPLSGALGFGDAAQTATMLVFVLLGDFRIFVLFAAATRPEQGLRRSVREAGLWTLFVPVFAGATNQALAALVPDLPDQVLWLIYELSFVAVALFLRNCLVPARIPNPDDRTRGALRAVATYVAFYYALWAAADVLITAVGMDAGWLLRVLPNQLYYAFTVPWVCFVFFRRT
ncbi:MAG: hypothetical protein ACE5FL_16235 [Myxococcota bacterium]